MSVALFLGESLDWALAWMMQLLIGFLGGLMLTIGICSNKKRKPTSHKGSKSTGGKPTQKQKTSFGAKSDVQNQKSGLSGKQQGTPWKSQQPQPMPHEKFMTKGAVEPPYFDDQNIAQNMPQKGSSTKMAQLHKKSKPKAKDFGHSKKSKESKLPSEKGSYQPIPVGTKLGQEISKEPEVIIAKSHREDLEDLRYIRGIPDSVPAGTAQEQLKFGHEEQPSGPPDSQAGHQGRKMKKSTKLASKLTSCQSDGLQTAVEYKSEVDSIQLQQTQSEDAETPFFGVVSEGSGAPGRGKVEETGKHAPSKIQKKRPTDSSGSVRLDKTQKEEDISLKPQAPPSTKSDKASFAASASLKKKNDDDSSSSEDEEGSSATSNSTTSSSAAMSGSSGSSKGGSSSGSSSGTQKSKKTKVATASTGKISKVTKSKTGSKTLTGNKGAVIVTKS